MDVPLVLADAVVTVHVGFLLFVVLGGFLALRGRRWIASHAAAVLWGLIGALHLLACPLTVVQKWLIRAGGGTPYSGSFTHHYLSGRLYPAVDRNLAAGVAGALVVASYVVVLSLRRRRRDRRSVGVA